MFIFLKNIWHLQSPNDMCSYVHSYRNKLRRVMSLIKDVLKSSFILSFLFFSCSPKIHENFESNHYIKDYRIHSFNDRDRKSTRLNSSHVRISYAVFCLKKKKKKKK